MLKQTLTTLGSLDKTIKELTTAALNDKKTKACLFNIVIDVQKTERLKYYQKVCKELIDQFPCRIFLIHFDESHKEPKIEASLLSPKSAPQLVCDYIEIGLKPNEYPRLFSLLFANFVNDLPVYYLPTEHTDHLSDFTQEMAKNVKRIICDSTDVVNLDAFIENMNTFKKLGIEFSDLNWSRIESWREIIAKNLSQDVLDHLDSVEIIYNHKKDSSKQYPFQALFLKGFLSKRLTDHHLKSAAIKLAQAEKAHIWEGAIISVTFIAKDAKQVFMRNLEKPEEAIIHFESKHECYIPQYVQFTKTESGTSLIKEIRHSSVSNDYQYILSNLKSYL